MGQEVPTLAPSDRFSHQICQKVTLGHPHMVHAGQVTQQTFHPHIPWDAPAPQTGAQVAGLLLFDSNSPEVGFCEVKSAGLLGFGLWKAQMGM